MECVCAHTSIIFDDDVIKSHMIKNIGCTPPYLVHPHNGSKSDCSSPQLLHEFYKMSVRKYLVPCRRMTQNRFMYKALRPSVFCKQEARKHIKQSISNKQALRPSYSSTTPYSTITMI